MHFHQFFHLEHPTQPAKKDVVSPTAIEILLTVLLDFPRFHRLVAFHIEIQFLMLKTTSSKTSGSFRTVPGQHLNINSDCSYYSRI